MVLNLVLSRVGISLRPRTNLNLVGQSAPRAAPIPLQILSGTGSKYNTDTRAAVTIGSKFSLNLVHLYTGVHVNLALQ